MHLRLIIAAVVFILLSITTMEVFSAQEKATPQLAKFGAASIKPIERNGATIVVGIDVFPGGRTVISGLPLKSLIATAFHLSYWQISGGDAWMTNDIYKIEASPGEDSAIKTVRHSLFHVEDEHLREMLQALLIDRFQLKFHREAKTGDVYVLERTDKPLKLRRPESPEQNPSKYPALLSDKSSIGYAGGKWRIWASTIPQLAKFASDFYLQAPVLDQTGLDGVFEYWQEMPDLDPKYTDHTDSFMNMIRELGFRLKRAEGPIEVLVIDSAAKPSAN